MLHTPHFNTILLDHSFHLLGAEASGWSAQQKWSWFGGGFGFPVGVTGDMVAEMRVDTVAHSKSYAAWAVTAASTRDQREYTDHCCPGQRGPGRGLGAREAYLHAGRHHRPLHVHSASTSFFIFRLAGFTLGARRRTYGSAAGRLHDYMLQRTEGIIGVLDPTVCGPHTAERGIRYSPQNKSRTALRGR